MDPLTQKLMEGQSSKSPCFFLPLIIGLRLREGPLHLDPRRAAFSSTGEVAGSESGAGGGNGGVFHHTAMVQSS